MKIKSNLKQSKEFYWDMRKELYGYDNLKNTVNNLLVNREDNVVCLYLMEAKLNIIENLYRNMDPAEQEYVRYRYFENHEKLSMEKYAEKFHFSKRSLDRFEKSIMDQLNKDLKKWNNLFQATIAYQKGSYPPVA